MDAKEFRFKQFRVRQQFAAMRVSTDGVLLGAWSRHPSPRRILDVGTGTGLLALMLAQRYPSARIDAIEVDEGALLDAERNFLDSPWSERLRLIGSDFVAWADHGAEAGNYDLIVCNPPFFSGQLPSANSQRRTARHENRMTLAVLVRAVASLMRSEGRFDILLPSQRGPELQAVAAGWSLYTNRVWAVSYREDQPCARWLISLSRQARAVERQAHFILESGTDRYTPDHWRLTEDFYLEDEKTMG